MDEKHTLREEKVVAYLSPDEVPTIRLPHDPTDHDHPIRSPRVRAWVRSWLRKRHKEIPTAARVTQLIDFLEIDARRSKVFAG
jgi:hypothetical protein